MERERGVALISVLLIVTIMATFSVYLAEDQQLSIRRIENHRDSEQAYQLATGGERWTLKILERDARETPIDHLNESWNRLLPQVDVGQGKLSVTAQDQQARFNLNNLILGKDEIWYPAFRRLLQMLNLDEGLADALVDWIDTDQTVTGVYGAEDSNYLSQEPPYRAANRVLTDVGELAWVKGFDATSIAKLSPYVTAVPANNVRINVNTCPPELLRIIANPLLSESIGESLAQGRGETGYADVDELLAHNDLTGQAQTAQGLVSVRSAYFEIKSRATFGRVVFVLYSLVWRAGDPITAVLLKRRRNWT